MHWLLCPVCRPWVLRRRRKWLADIDARGRIAYYEGLRR